jgi:hypothetical protein
MWIYTSWALRKKQLRKHVRAQKLESLLLSTSKMSLAVIQFAETLSNIELTSPPKSKFSPKPLLRNTPAVALN